MDDNPLPPTGSLPDSNASNDWPVDVAEAIAGGLTDGVSAVAALLVAQYPGAAVGVATAAGALQGSLERRLTALLRLIQEAAQGDREAELRDVLTNHPGRASLVLDAAEAMAKTGYEVKVEALARAIASGMLYEDDVRFDVEEAIVRTIMALDRLQVAILFEIHGDYVDESELEARLAQYAFVLPAKLNELRRLGLTAGSQEDPEHPGLWMFNGHKLTELGREVRQRLQSAADALA